MDASTIKEKIIRGEISEEELASLLAGKTTHSQKSGPGFLKTILKGFIEGYTTPNLWRLTMESLLLLMVIIAVVILSYAGKIDATITSVLLAFVLGFLFGKIR